jgi:Na+-transporting NADH:ubiquinone oxidoreductase subunit D
MISVKTKIKPLLDPLIDQNPLTYMILVYCSALAVTVQMKTALVMTVAVIFVLTVSSTIILYKSATTS